MPSDMTPLQPSVPAPGTYLSFRLGAEVFAIDVGCVREILDQCRITHVPAAPRHMLGVINVRGMTTAVMDLGLRFGLEAVKTGMDTRIIIMELLHDGEAIVVGGMADSVREVLALETQDLGAAPSLAMKWRGDFVRGVARKNGEYIIILDIVRLLLSEQAPGLNREGADGTQRPATEQSSMEAS